MIEGEDDVESYEHTTVQRGDVKISFLLHRPDGACVYLGASGCTIHDRAPLVCREFDCRKQYLTTSRAFRRAGVARGKLDKEILDAGKERVWSLTADDWVEIANRKTLTAAKDVD